MSEIPKDVMKAAEEAELVQAARDFMFLFIVDGGARGISLEDIDPMEFSQKFAALEAALSTSGMQEICSVSFADHEAATELLRDFNGTEGGLVTVDWYSLRSKIADKISMTRFEERDLCRTALSGEERRARREALEEAAILAGSIGDEQIRFGSLDLETSIDKIIVAIRALIPSEPHDAEGRE